jgi:hypothetical protein
MCTDAGRPRTGPANQLPSIQLPGYSFSASITTFFC